MLDVQNPFRASLGANPPLLVGRNKDIEDFEWALHNGPGTHERISVVVGPRGVGKTVLLNRFEDIARREGWHVFAETATPGFTHRLIQRIDESCSQGLQHTHISGISVAGWGIHFDKNNETGNISPSLRDSASRLLDIKAQLDTSSKQTPTGLLVTIDELHYAQYEEITQFAADIQHLVRENRDIAVVLAGIPNAILPLLSDDEKKSQMTFIRRANRINLGQISDSDVRQGLLVPVQDSGLEWLPEALDRATEACDGYPFMIQLVGQWTFHQAVRGDRRIINVEDAKDGIEKARRKLGQLVHEPALHDLSDVDRTVLVAMSLDDGPTTTAQLAERMKVSPAYIQRYRRRLLDADMITIPRRGLIDFALPYMREYLREHGATIGFGTL